MAMHGLWVVFVPRAKKEGLQRFADHTSRHDNIIIKLYTSVEFEWKFWISCGVITFNLIAREIQIMLGFFCFMRSYQNDSGSWLRFGFWRGRTRQYAEFDASHALTLHIPERTSYVVIFIDWVSKYAAHGRFDINSVWIDFVIRWHVITYERFTWNKTVCVHLASAYLICENSKQDIIHANAAIRRKKCGIYLIPNSSRICELALVINSHILWYNIECAAWRKCSH